MIDPILWLIDRQKFVFSLAGNMFFCIFGVTAGDLELKG
jgi:hypothetical protein